MEEIFVKYWSQILLLITTIGIGLKMVFNYRLKKKEINHSIFQQNRMDALVRFYNAYAEVNSMWVKLPIYKILKTEISSEQIDNIIQPPLNKLEASVLILQLYFEENIFEMFKKVERNMFRINGHYLNISFDFKEDETIINKANNYVQFREGIETENAKIIKEISASISKVR
jgi:hypothetical protein